MKLYYILRNKLNLLFIPVVLFAMVSCGSYQYSGYEADGIYGESRPGIWEQEEPQTKEVRPNNNNNYYKNLFAQQSEMYGEILESDIFTDVESYTSNDGYENYNDVGGDVAYVGGNAPWGDDPDTYTINIYNDGFYGGYYSPWRYGWAYGYPSYYYGGWYDPFYNPYWYYPYGYRGYWGGPIAYGYGSYWNIGFGFGYHYYGGYYNPYYRHYYGHHYYPYNYNNNIAYNQGRRNSRVYYSDGENRRSLSSRNSSSYSRSIREIRNSRSSDYGTSRVRSSASNTDDRRIYTRTNRRTESPRSYDYNRSRNSSPVYQRSSQSNNRTYRSSPSRRSSSSTRSSTTRSSSSSSRSSGTTRSSGGRSSRGGRGGSQ